MGISSAGLFLCVVFKLCFLKPLGKHDEKSRCAFLACTGFFTPYPENGQGPAHHPKNTGLPKGKQRLERARSRRSLRLLAQPQTLNQAAVAIGVGALEVVQQGSALADHFEQTSAGMVILAMFLEMSGQTVNAGCQESHLHFRRAGVSGSALVICDNLGFVCGFESHVFLLIVVRDNAKGGILVLKSHLVQQ
jgi:hypothetical protein